MPGTNVVDGRFVCAGGKDSHLLASYYAMRDNGFEKYRFGLTWDAVDLRWYFDVLDGARTVFHDGGSGYASSAGDYWMVELVGNDFQVWQGPSATGSWTLRHSATDATSQVTGAGDWYEDSYYMIEHSFVNLDATSLASTYGGEALAQGKSISATAGAAGQPVIAYTGSSSGGMWGDALNWSDQPTWGYPMTAPSGVAEATGGTTQATGNSSGATNVANTSGGQALAEGKIGAYSRVSVVAPLNQTGGTATLWGEWPTWGEGGVWGGTIATEGHSGGTAVAEGKSVNVSANGVTAHTQGGVAWYYDQPPFPITYGRAGSKAITAGAEAVATGKLIQATATNPVRLIVSLGGQALAVGMAAIARAGQKATSTGAEAVGSGGAAIVRLGVRIVTAGAEAAAEGNASIGRGSYRVITLGGEGHRSDVGGLPTVARLSVQGVTAGAEAIASGQASTAGGGQSHLSRGGEAICSGGQTLASAGHSVQTTGGTADADGSPVLVASIARILTLGGTALAEGLAITYHSVRTHGNQALAEGAVSVVSVNRACTTFGATLAAEGALVSAQISAVATTAGGQASAQGSDSTVTRMGGHGQTAGAEAFAQGVLCVAGVSVYASSAGAEGVASGSSFAYLANSTASAQGGEARAEGASVGVRSKVFTGGRRTGAFATRRVRPPV